MITEFLAANNSGLLDEDGATSDWIEIHNADTNTVDLAGWRLTDDSDDFAKWIFPATNLPPGEFLVVFASGKNRLTPGTPLHTSFSLAADGEYLALIQPDGLTVASEYAPAFPPQLDDISYGVTPTNAAEQKFFALLTPGATNSTSYFAQAAAPQFNPERGFYTTNISVTITSATPAAIIRYTLNGIPPTATTGFIYTLPIVITNTTALRAAAFQPDATPSPVVTHTYIFLRDVVKQSANGLAPSGWPSSWGGNSVDYGMDPNIVNVAPWADAITNALQSIPTISLVLPLNALFHSTTGIYANASQDGIAWERATSVELLNPAGDRAKQFQINAGLRIRGGWSRQPNNPKHSFRVLLRAEYGANRLNYPFFGPTAASSFDKFDLRSHQDDSWHFFNVNGEILRDSFSRDSQLALGRRATHGNFYHLYLNGQYWGLFTSEERPEASFGESYFGGDKINYDVVKVDADADFTIRPTDGDLAAWLRLWEAATNGLATAAAYQEIQGNHPDGTPNPALENLLDVPGLIDYMLVILYAGNIDAPISNFQLNEAPNNWYGLRERSGLRGGFRFVMHDSENSLYNLSDNRTGPFPAGDPAQGSIAFSNSNPQYLWQKLSANPEFRVLVGDHVQRHFFNDGALTVTAITNRYHARRNEIDRAVIAESARWGDAKREPPFTYDDWRTASDGLLTNYFPFRTAIVINQLRAKNLFPALSAPVLSQFGGSVPAGFLLTLTHTNAAGAIYFTTDGSDPRLPGGAIAPAAQSYETAITITQPTRIRTRVKNGTTWSALTDATFTPPQDLTKLALTEVMYNPPVFNAISGNDLEYLEFKNFGSNTLNLSGLTFSAGLTYTFPNNTLLPPGAFLVLARNATALITKYPGISVHSTYTGQLDNSGETLTLSFPLGGVVFSFNYDDQAPWPITPDGQGFSLVPKQPGATSAPDNGTRWRASAMPGGSTGADDPEPDIPPIVINEILAHTDLPQRDAIELYNPTGTNVDVSGWYLTDSSTAPKKYRIPAGSIIPAEGFLLFDDSQFNSGTDGNTAFLFSSTGEEVYLTSATNTALTGYSHGFVFGASFNGVSFGRHVNSAGEELFPAQISVTLDITNAGPRVAPIVFNEIHYRPGSLEEDEFVELLNFSDIVAPLFHPDFPTNTWRINGLSYVFPTNILLAPAELLVLVPIDPEVFRTKYNLPTNVQILGPYLGTLDNNGERLTLEAPDNPNLGIAPYVAMEEVRYNDKSPWPIAADGSGPSLQRISAWTFGNDPTNWIAASATPGAFSPTADSDGDGMPDHWELFSGTNWKAPDADTDPDQDGMTNLEEFRSGTDPQLAASVLRLQIFAGPANTNCCPWLELEAMAERTYSVMFCTATNLGAWVKFTDVTAETTNRLVQIPFADPSEEARFFKVTTPALP